jgi:hypothetical protein
VTTLGGPPSSCHGFVTADRSKKSGERRAAVGGCCKETLPEDGVDTRDKSLTGNQPTLEKKTALTYEGSSRVVYASKYCFASRRVSENLKIRCGRTSLRAT